MKHRIGNLRREFLHKTTSHLVASCAVIAMGALRTQNMSRSAKGTQDKPGRMVRQKAGLNREIRCAYAWNGRSGETATAGAATRQVRVHDPRNPAIASTDAWRRESS